MNPDLSTIQFEREPTHALISSEPTPGWTVSAESRLRNPRPWLLTAFNDLKAAMPVAKLLFKRQLNQNYRQSSLGLLWLFLPPLATVGVVMSGHKFRLFEHDSGGIPPGFFAIFGVLFGVSFLEAVNLGRNVFVEHSHVFQRTDVPLEGFILSRIGLCAFSFMVRIGVCIFSASAYDVGFARTWPLALAAALATVLIGLSGGLFLAPISAMARDFDHLMTLFPWVFFGLTPVLSKVSGASPLAKLVELNPFSWLFDGTRALAYGAPNTSTTAALIAIPLAIAFSVIAWLFCRLAQPYVVERVLA